MISLRSIDEKELEEIHSYQNSDCTRDVAEFFDMPVKWAPMSIAEIREKIEGEKDNKRIRYFSIWHENDFVGIGTFTSNWDTWGPYAGIVIWPEFRNKGLGTEAAKQLLDMSFLENPAHAMVQGAPDWNIPSIGLIKKLGFKEAGRMRDADMKNGKHHDWLFFDILKSEYIKTRGVES